MGTQEARAKIPCKIITKMEVRLCKTSNNTRIIEARILLGGRVAADTVNNNMTIMQTIMQGYNRGSKVMVGTQAMGTRMLQGQQGRQLRCLSKIRTYRLVTWVINLNNSKNRYLHKTIELFLKSFLHLHSNQIFKPKQHQLSTLKLSNRKFRIKH
jgi:hypothetical protein